MIFIFGDVKLLLVVGEELLRRKCGWLKKIFMVEEGILKWRKFWIVLEWLVYFLKLKYVINIIYE